MYWFKIRTQSHPPTRCKQERLPSVGMLTTLPTTKRLKGRAWREGLFEIISRCEGKKNHLPFTDAEYHRWKVDLFPDDGNETWALVSFFHNSVVNFASFYRVSEIHAKLTMFNISSVALASMWVHSNYIPRILCLHNAHVNKLMFHPPMAWQITKECKM